MVRSVGGVPHVIVDSTGGAGTGPRGRERPPGTRQELQSIAIF